MSQAYSARLKAHKLLPMPEKVIDKVKHKLYNAYRKIMKGFTMANKNQKLNQTKNIAKETVREIVALWRLIVTVAQGMAAYILIPQSNWTFKVVGAILVANATYMAVVHYTRKSA